jgi:hypothetical protein
VLRSSPAVVAAIVFAVYAGWVAHATDHLNHKMTDFAFIGEKFVDQSSSSPAINADKAHIQSDSGYDGQYFLYIAQDPAGARPYLDNASYRYGRIVYPLLARGLALGRQDTIPFMLVGVNVLAIALGTFALGVILRRHDQSPWYALLFASYPGIFVALLRDLSEALAYALAAGAVAIFDRGGSGRALIGSAALFAVAILTRETTALFALAAAIVLGLRDRGVQRALPFVVGALLPYVLYRGVFLEHWLGHAGVPDSLRPVDQPFAGITHYLPFDTSAIKQIYAVIIPAVFCLGLAVWGLTRRPRELGFWAIALNVLVVVVFVAPGIFQDYFASFRITTGIVVAFIVAIPTLAKLLPGARAWFWLPTILWMSVWWDLLPAAFQTQF